MVACNLIETIVNQVELVRVGEELVVGYDILEDDHFQLLLLF